MSVSLPGSTNPLTYVELRYRIVDADNYWLARIWRNTANDAWNFSAGVVEDGGDPVFTVDTEGVGTPDAVRVVVSGTSHEWFTGVSGTFTSRGSTTSAMHQGAALIGVSYTGAVGDNLVTNGDMEDGPPFTGWSDNGSITYDVAAERPGGSGTQSMEFTSSDNARQVGQTADVVDGATYIVAAWAVGGANNPFVGTTIGGFNSISGFLPNDSTWRAYAGRCTSTSTGSVNAIYYRSNNTTVVWDDAAIWLVGALDDGSTGPTLLEVG